MLKVKITIYELLDLIKNDKAPKKIKYNELIWCFDDGLENYEQQGIRLFDILFKRLVTSTALEEKVEIPEEPKKIEKISWREKESLAGELTANEKQNILARRTEKLKSSLNELIDEINNLKEE